MDATAEQRIAALRAAVDGVLELPLSPLSGLELAEVITGLEVQRRRLDAADVQVLASAQACGLVQERCATSLPDLLSDLARVSRTEARARAQRATDLGPRVALSGEPLEPIHPRAAAALVAGEIAAAHVDVITHALGRIPPALSIEAFSVCETYLVQAARHEDPVGLRRCAQLMLARLDQDGREPQDEQRERDRNFGFGGRRGPNAVFGSVTDEAKAVWQTILDSLAAPRPADDGIPDDRTAGQRYHDALLEAGMRLLRSDTLPATGGVPVSVIIRIDAEDLDRAQQGQPGGIAQTAHGDIISAERVLRLAGDASTTDVVRGPMGGILDYGRTRRLACPEQRRALAARDGGCCFPRCTRPSAWTEVHHIRAWIRGGRTSLDNMCLLCAFHHREFERRGWVVELVDGVPQWTPPATVDPSRRPRRNTAHHLPQMSFGRTPTPG